MAAAAGGGMTDMVVNLFAGPGGWCEGVRAAGYDGDMAGLEWDRDACATAYAAGHLRIRCDVATYPTAPFRGAVGVIGSPPCTAWSSAGDRGGEVDRPACHELVDRMADGDDATDWREWEDPRAPLVAQPVRWVRDLRPRWVLLEQVPEVLALWKHIARVFRGWGYAVWCGVLRADAYGVAQTRRRAILIAHRDRARIDPPTPTHALWPHEPEPDLFGDGLQRWVSMADALGWGMGERPCMTVTAGGTGKGAAEPIGNGARKSMVREMTEGRWVAKAAGRTGESRPRDPDGAPSATLTGKGTATWVHERPSTTVCGDPRIAEPGHRDRAGGERQYLTGGGNIRLTVEECARLQSFRPDYPWRGTKTAQYRQVGDAVPPRLAAAIAATVL